MQHCFPVLLVYFKPEHIDNNSALKCDHILFGDVFFGNVSVFYYESRVDRKWILCNIQIKTIC